MTKVNEIYDEWQTQLADLSAQASEADNLDDLTDIQRDLERLYIRYSQRIAFELTGVRYTGINGTYEGLVEATNVLYTMVSEYRHEWESLNKRITAELTEWFAEQS